MRQTLIQNVVILVGREFKKLDRGNLLIEDGVIKHVGTEKPTNVGIPPLNGEGLICIPGLIDAHTHIGDSIAKDVGVGKTLRELVHPLDGMKTQILVKESPEAVREAISQTARDMLSCGITTFADFREGGLQGVETAAAALSKCKQRVQLLCRPNLAYSEDDVCRDMEMPESALREAERALTVSSGFGLSGANEYTNRALRQIARLADEKGKLIAIHAAESVESVKFSNDMFHATEIERLLTQMVPNFLVHVTHPTSTDLRKIADRGLSIVCCPRANASLGVGFPPISKFLDLGIKVAIGTDNVMLNAPDMFRELDYTARMIKATAHNPAAITSEQILSMATSNAADILGLGSIIGTLEVGKKADIIFLDMTAPNLCFSRDLVSSIVHRARPDNIVCVMIQGEIAHGSLEI
jgi:cytosine/adenosine deaminase-related metal-dependent hydrolase